MKELAFFLLSGAALGGLYGLLALGFVVIYKATHVLNFAHGSFVLLGAYVVARFSSWSFWGALAIGVLVTVVLALLAERLLIRTMAGRAVLSVTIMTVGLDIVLLTAARTEINTQLLPTRDPWGDKQVVLLGLVMPQARLVALLVSIVVAVSFFIWLRYSRWGLAFRAATEKREAAALMGIGLGTLSALAWAIAGALATVSGVLLATYPYPGVNLDLGTIALAALPAAVIGGLESAPGAIIGGLIVGIGQILVQGYQEYLTWLGAGFHEVFTFGLMLLVLLVRPQGLFGQKEIVRA